MNKIPIKCEHPYTVADVSPMKCICCSKPIYKLMEDEDLSKSSPESSMWNDCVVEKIHAGYGSGYDGSVFLIGICDECIEKKIKDQSIVYLYDYLSKYAVKKLREDYNGWLHHRMKNRLRVKKLKRILNGRTLD